MNTKKFSEAMGAIDSKYIDEAIHYEKKTKKHSWTKWSSLAACLCLLLVAAFSMSQFMQPSDISNPQPQPDTLGSDKHTQPNNPIDSSTQDDEAKHKTQNAVIDETMTLEEAQHSEPFGDYMPSTVPSGFAVETIKRYQDENANFLFGLWTKGEGSFDEISWRVSFYDKSMENLITSVNDTKNYDLSLYSSPLADSVPEELFEIVDHPIFSIDELTLEAVNRRAYSISENDTTTAIRMNFGVRYKDIVVEVATKGVSPEWVYEQLINTYQFRSSKQR